ncbi:hypothetical protein PILCRDRAFT_35618, partial [Piloderma croceum F 1598]
NHLDHGSVFTLVDTPGFDDAYKSDIEILTMIADWVVKSYKKNANPASIIYLHGISDNRMTGSVLKKLEKFALLCGQVAVSNVVIATTMWGEINKEMEN